MLNFQIELAKTGHPTAHKSKENTPSSPKCPCKCESNKEILFFLFVIKNFRTNSFKANEKYDIKFKRKPVKINNNSIKFPTKYMSKIIIKSHVNGPQIKLIKRFFFGNMRE